MVAVHSKVAHAEAARGEGALVDFFCEHAGLQVLPCELGAGILLGMQAPLNIDPQDARLRALEHRVGVVCERIAALRETQTAQRALVKSLLRPRQVSLRLSQDEALVLFAWLVRAQPASYHAWLEDQAEQRVLWDIECLLEAHLDGVFAQDFLDHLANARDRVRDES